MSHISMVFGSFRGVFMVPWLQPSAKQDRRLKQITQRRLEKSKILPSPWYMLVNSDWQ